jgi:hypothetical protein
MTHERKLVLVWCVLILFCLAFWAGIILIVNELI